MAFTYILQCSDGSYYVGRTENLDQRIKQHQSGYHCSYTKYYRPVQLVYREEYETIQKYPKRTLGTYRSKAKKDALIKGIVSFFGELRKPIWSIPF